MLKFLIRATIIFILNYILIIQSVNIDISQVIDDLGSIVFIRNYKYNSTFIITLICLTSTMITLLLILFFKPFMEVYLLFYMKINFYFFITLLSLATTYLIFRIYGYSRLLIIVYLLFTSAVLLVSDKIMK